MTTATLYPPTNELLETVQVQIDLLPAQAKALTDPSPTVALIGSVRAGKSRYLGYEFFKFTQNETNLSPTLAVSLTHDTLDKGLMPVLKQILKQVGIEYVHRIHPPKEWIVPLRSEYSKWQNCLVTNTGHVIVTGTFDNIDAIRGNGYGLVLLDEVAFCNTDYEFRTCDDRLACPFAKERKMRVATSPWGQNWLWSLFAGPFKAPGYAHYHASLLDNRFLPDDYKIRAKSGRQGADYEREILGLWTPVGSNRCYTEYDELRHDTRWTYQENLPLHVGCDFNRSPLCWEICQHDENGNMHFFDEIYIPSEATTIMASDDLLARYPGAKIAVWPDIAGTHETTASGNMSDVEILQKSGFEVMLCANKNPLQSERVEAMQKRLRRDALLICRERCPRLVTSMLTTNYQPGIRKIKKTKGLGTEVTGEHPSDAAGYHVYWYDVGEGYEFLDFEY